VAIQWRKLAELAFSRSTKTAHRAEKALLLDIAARYRELAEQTEGKPAASDSRRPEKE
jgi:hypothetical protein